MNLAPRIFLSTLIVISILVLAVWCLLEVGYANAGTIKDSLGNELGFNNPLTFELMIGLSRVAYHAGWSEWSRCAWSLVCAAMQIWGLVWLCRPSRPTTAVRAWAALQTAFFFPGLLGLLIWLHFLFSLQPLDGEALSEPPGIFVTAAPWLVITWAFLLLTRSPKLADQPT